MLCNTFTKLYYRQCILTNGNVDAAIFLLLHFGLFCNIRNEKTKRKQIYNDIIIVWLTCRSNITIYIFIACVFDCWHLRHDCVCIWNDSPWILIFFTPLSLSLSTLFHVEVFIVVGFFIDINIKLINLECNWHHAVDFSGLPF